MLYALICTDKPNSLAIRMGKRPEHVAYLKSLGDTLKLAGPFTEADGETMNGSLIVIEAESLAAAEAFAREDPYTLNGVFERVEVHPCLQVFPKENRGR